MTAAFHEPQAAYVHVPFCAHRCGYCDFTLVAGRDDLIDRYLAALEIDLQTLKTRQPIQTLFLGGGTPTHLSVSALSRLMDLLHRWFDLSAEGEFSVEANPADLGTDKIHLLADAGVNRVSLGAQSFDAGVLGRLERDHRAADVLRTVEQVRRRIDNLSLDLIFAVPGQSLDLWTKTLDTAIDLQPRHISTYGLTFEKGTTFWSRWKRDTLRRAPEELEREMYAAAMDRLADAGFAQYEISNFAQPGFECRHNLVYWRGEAYYGFGPGAARYLGGCRSTNHRSVTTWLKRIETGCSPMAESEQLSDENRAREMLALGLRMTAGVGIDRFRERTGFEMTDLAREALERYGPLGLLEHTPSRIRLSLAGRFVADTIVGACL